MSAEHYVSKCVLELVVKRAGEISKSVQVTVGDRDTHYPAIASADWVALAGVGTLAILLE
jgi:hypothetical protein